MGIDLETRTQGAPKMYRITLEDLNHLTACARAACKSGSSESPFVQAKVEDGRLTMESSAGHVLGQWSAPAVPGSDGVPLDKFDPEKTTLVLRCESNDIKNAVNAMPRGTVKNHRIVEITYADRRLKFRHEFDDTHATESEFVVPGDGEVIKTIDHPRMHVSSLILQSIFKTFDEESECLIEAIDLNHAVRITEIPYGEDSVMRPRQTYYVMQMRV
jgi:hypothetical protein